LLQSLGFLLSQSLGFLLLPSLVPKTGTFLENLPTKALQITKSCVLFLRTLLQQGSAFGYKGWHLFLSKISNFKFVFGPLASYWGFRVRLKGKTGYSSHGKQDKCFS
jgi:hypothetical protein